MFKKLLAVVGLSLTIVGCASVPMGDAGKNSELKKFAVKEDVAGIYIYRNETFGAALKMNVFVDGKLLGQTAAHTYLYTEVPPGSHAISSKDGNAAELTINAVAGKLYYIWQEVKMGLVSGNSKLNLVDEATGQKGVGETNLAVSQ